MEIPGGSFKTLIDGSDVKSVKAELLQEGIFFLIHLFARDVLVMKKLEIEKTKSTLVISVLKVDIIKVDLVFSISNFFITETPLANNWRRKKNTFLCEFGFINNKIRKA